MASQEPLSRSGLISRAGIPNDVMTFWVRRGLVRPIYAPSGTGRHLRFEWYEANIAAIMSQLRQFGLPIEGLLAIANTFRESIAWASSYELTRDDVNALQTVFNAYSSHDRHGDDEQLQETLATFSLERHGASRITDRIQAIHATMPKEEFYRHLDPFMSITEQPKVGDPGLDNAHLDEMTYFWRFGEGENYRFAWGTAAGDLARQDGALSMVAVDITAALYAVWNQPESEGE